MKPFMSIVVISYNMNRELPQTIYSLSADFQRDISRDEYEVILIDNGSRIPPVMEDFAGLDIDLTIHHFDNPTHSPVSAVNLGINMAAGQFVGVCIDGARIHSPRVLATAREGLSMSDRSVVAIRGRYLGDKLQREAMAEGYDQAFEDKMLEESGWKTNGYRLFDISVFDESSGQTWFDQIFETNALFMGRSLWHEINGLDPQFKSPGGGLVNLDTWTRALELPNVNPMILFGEATFHQIHGGVATNGTVDTISTFFDEYEKIRGHEYIGPQVEVSLLGKIHHEFHPGEGLTMNQKRGPAKNKNLVTSISKFTVRNLPPKFIRKLRTGYGLWAAIARRNPMEGIRHFRLEKHLTETLEAHPLFDSEWYEMTYPHVSAAGYKPSLHYVRHGAAQRTMPGPIFDAVWYMNHYPDIGNSGENPLIHFLQHGETEGRRVRVNSQGFGSYERSGEQELRQILINSTLFDSDWYVSQYPEVLQSKLDPEIDYLRFGVLLRRNPSEDFDGVRYRREYLDVQNSGINPLIHFESSGRVEGRSYHPVSE
jgi:glycosyltransferase involved in cell wall biosynthesis